MNFKEQLSSKSEEINELIKGYLPVEEGFAKELAGAMNYSMLAGGKRLRPMLMAESFRLFSDSISCLKPFMAAIEMIHTHSLVHDDLPALDNDALRRGKPTTHVQFGENLAILAGDALLNYAYETAFLAFQEEGTEALRIAKALRILGQKSGISGMLGGQSVDVKNEGVPLSKELLEYIYRNKTSALIEASMMIGAILGGADEQQVGVMETVGYKVGLAFQIQDDILDVIGAQEKLGKPIHSDVKNHKTTYVSLFGLDEAKRQVEQLSREAIELLVTLERKNEFLVALLQSLITRKK